MLNAIFFIHEPNEMARHGPQILHCQHMGSFRTGHAPTAHNLAAVGAKFVQVSTTEFEKYIRQKILAIR